MVQEVSSETHDRVFDAILALRCWRDLDRELPAQNMQLWELASQQIERAHPWRDHLGASKSPRRRMLRPVTTTQLTLPTYALSGPSWTTGLRATEELSQAWENSEFDGTTVDIWLEQAFACP